jgi:hypothetical protein
MISLLQSHVAREQISEHHRRAAIARQIQEARRDGERAHDRQVERVRASVLVGPHTYREPREA